MGTMTPNSNGDFPLSITVTDSPVTKTFNLSTDSLPTLITGDIVVSVTAATGSRTQWNSSYHYKLSAGGFFNKTSGSNSGTASWNNSSRSYVFNKSAKALNYNGTVATIRFNTKNTYAPANSKISFTVNSFLNRNNDYPDGYCPKASTDTWMCFAHTGNYDTNKITSPIMDYISYGHSFYVMDSYSNACYVQAVLGSTTYNISAGSTIQVVKTTKSTGGYYTGTPGTGIVWHPGTTTTVWVLRVDGSEKDYVTSVSSMNFYARTSDRNVSNSLFIRRTT